MSAASITGYLAGLFACYFCGLKWGAVVKIVKDLGRVSSS